jgi:hypothetical protein
MFFVKCVLVFCIFIAVGAQIDSSFESDEREEYDETSGSGDSHPENTSDNNNDTDDVTDYDDDFEFDLIDPVDPLDYGSSIDVVKLLLENNQTWVIDQTRIDEIFLHPEVVNRTIVTLSVSGSEKRRNSFLLNYFLRFMYANVSFKISFMIHIKCSNFRLCSTNPRISQITRWITRAIGSDRMSYRLDSLQTLNKMRILSQKSHYGLTCFFRTLTLRSFS